MKPKLRWVHGLFLMSVLATSFSGCGDDGPDTDSHDGGSSGKGPFHSGAGGMISGGSPAVAGGGSDTTPEGGAGAGGVVGSGGSGDAGHAGSGGSGAETGAGGAAGVGGDDSGGNGGESGSGTGGGGTGGGGGKGGTAGTAGNAGNAGKGGTSGAGGGGAGGGGTANLCGDGKLDDPLEQCDKGSAANGCSASCTLTSCDSCRTEKLATLGVGYLSCTSLTGADKTLCENLLRCIRRTHCAEQYTDLDGYLEPRACYCGAIVSDDCFKADRTNSNDLHGACVAEVIAAAKQTVPSQIGSLLFDNATAVGKVFGLLRGELTSECVNECATCSTCRGVSCSTQSANRANLCSGARADQCAAYLSCIDQQNCAANPRSCYCGTTDATSCFADAATATTPNGKCRDLANALAGSTTPKEVGRQMGDNTTALGAISELLTCSNTSCQTLCSPTPSSSGGSGGNGGTSGNAGRSGGGSGG